VKNFRNIAQVRQPRESNGLVIHVSSLNDRSTEVVMTDTVRIGTGEDCDVKIKLAQTAENSPITAIEIKRVDGVYRIANVDQALDIKLNDRTIKPNKGIHDGDEIWIGPSGPSIHFFPITSTTAMVPGRRGSTHVAPFIEQAAMEASATARRDDAKIFLREFTRELVREINPSTKIIIFAIIIFAVVGGLYLGFAQYNETRQNRRIIAEQQGRLIAQQEQMQKANQQLTQVLESNKQVLNTLSLGEMLRVNYGEGVCLIYGSYMFVEAGTGRPLRNPETQTNENGSTVQNGTDQPELTPEGNGQIADYQFVGTGFHTGDGYILTNRHVVQPWLADERAQSLTSTVNGKPRLRKLIAFFPDSTQALTIKYKQAASGEDLAVCTVDPKELPAKLPVLPLERQSDTVAIGRIVVTMGYPSGPDRLLAMLDENEARGVQNRYGSTEALLSYLAQSKHVRPLMTQGHITDLDVKRIVYDAPTGEGGSGGPLFGPSGRVIGITFAVFTENSASNFAIPIHYAISLLERAGWTSPVTPEPDQKETANLQAGGK
jgi:S1-C subfamily serine protease